MEETKRCTRCGGDFPLSGFYRDSRSRDGHRGSCKLCVDRYRHDHYPEYQDRAKRYRELNRDRLREQSRAYYRANKARLNARRVLLRRPFRKPGDYRQLALALSDLTPEQWERILAFYEYRCCYCGSEGPLTRDHVLPLKWGGMDTASNVVPACVPCNMSKQDRDVYQWVGERNRAT